jgi:hypothetical protein
MALDLTPGGGLRILDRGTFHQTLNGGAVEHRQPGALGGIVATARRKPGAPPNAKYLMKI